jgi:sugar O-acyltransferase (sialic acid O-acetyltransferase NeuD family)
MTPVLLYGASGHAKVILELLEEAGHPILGCVANNPEDTTLLGYPVWPWGQQDASGAAWIIAIGDNAVRRDKAALVGPVFTSIAHPNSALSPRSVWGTGTVMMSGTSVNSSTVIGAHCIINTHASVDHDCILGDFVHIAPNAVLCGGVEVGTGTLVGAGAVVIPRIKIGRWAVIGAGAVIRSDVPDGALVAGNPGRIFSIKDTR